MNNLTRLFIFGTAFALLFAALNLYNGDFGVLRWTVFISGLILAYAAYQSHVWWFIVFATITILFNPFYQFLALTKETWQEMDILAAAVFSIFITSEETGTKTSLKNKQDEENYKKGIDFEEFVSSTLFPKNIWAIEDRTKDSSKKLERLVESDMHPDYRFRHKTTGQRFAVECKYRSKFFKGGIEWQKGQQGERYRVYGETHNIPVFVAIGIGGNPDNPARLFFCPLEKLGDVNHGFITENDLIKFERDPKKSFSIDTHGGLI